MANSVFKVDTSQLRRLERSLSKAGASFEKGKKLLLKKIGAVVQGTAKGYSPESPTIGMYAKMNKSGVTNRKRSNITTGSLRDSISTKTGKDEVSIFVAANSRAGKYAEKIHDGKGKSWKKRGPRTVQKGAKADDKFIDRAYLDREKNIAELVDSTIDTMINSIGV